MRTRGRTGQYICSRCRNPLRGEVETLDGDLVDVIEPCAECGRSRFMLKPNAAPRMAVTPAGTSPTRKPKPPLPARRCKACPTMFVPPPCKGRPVAYCASCRAHRAGASKGRPRAPAPS